MFTVSLTDRLLWVSILPEANFIFSLESIESQRGDPPSASFKTPQTSFSIV